MQLTPLNFTELTTCRHNMYAHSILLTTTARFSQQLEGSQP